MSYNKKFGYYITPTGFKTLYSGSVCYYGQSFYNSDKCYVTVLQAAFFLKYLGDGSQTGNLYAKIYAHYGTYGTNSTCSTLLATSDAIAANTLTADGELVKFTFTGANGIVLARNTYYSVALYYDGSNASNNVGVGYDDVTLLDAGNAFYSSDGSSWTAEAYQDCLFFVYGDTENLESRVYAIEQYLGLT